MKTKGLFIALGVVVLISIGFYGFRLFESYVHDQYSENEGNGKWVLKTYFAYSALIDQEELQSLTR